MKNCENCAFPLSEAALFCSKCGLKISIPEVQPLQQSISDNYENVANSKSTRNPVKTISLLVIIGIIAVIAISTLGSSSDSTGSTTDTNPTPASVTVDQPQIPDTSWIPTGYNQYPNDDNLAWRWGTTSETNCTYSTGSCWSLMVISQNGCPTSLYGEIKIFDSSGIQIDYTNDTTSTVSPMQVVKLTFDTFNENAAKAGVGKLDCG